MFLFKDAIIIKDYGLFVTITINVKNDAYIIDHVISETSVLNY